MIGKSLFKKHIVGYTFYIIAFLCFTIFSSYDAILTTDLKVPVIFLFLFLFLISFFYFAINFNLKIPAVPAILLLARATLFFLNGVLIGADFTTIFQEIGTTIISILILIFTYSYSSCNMKETTIMIALFSLITTIQLVVGIFIYGKDKGTISAGIGMSNYAATFCLFAFTYFLFQKRSKITVFIIIISLIGLLSTQSFGAYMALLVIVILRLKTYYNWHRFSSWLYLGCFILLIIVMAFIFYQTDFGKPIIDKITIKTKFFFEGKYEAAFSSRFSLYNFTINNIGRNLLFGNIYNFNPAIVQGDLLYKWQYFRTHNFVLESLLLYGVIGSIFNFIILLYIFKVGIKRCKQYPLKRCILFAIIAVLIHGLVEPNFFTMHFEIMFWAIIGNLLSKNQTRKNLTFYSEETKTKYLDEEVLWQHK